MRVGERTHLLLAQLLWTVVGIGLFGVGLRWVLIRYGAMGALYTLPFGLLALLKAFFILDHSARRAVERIGRLGGGHVLALYSPGMWLLALGMILLGQILRASPLPRENVGFLYETVGLALIIASRNLWLAWWRVRAAEAPISRRP